MKDFYDLIEKYGDITPMILSSQFRYNNRIRIKNEDLAQHSYYVAYNIMNIGHDFNIDKSIIQDAVCRAIVHDMDEQYTSDIPHNCKVEYPELREIVRSIGFKYIVDKANFATQWFIDYNNNDDLANVLVEIGDILSVLQYSNREIQLGNTNLMMVEIKKDAIARLEIAFPKIDKYRGNVC